MGVPADAVEDLGAMGPIEARPYRSSGVLVEQSHRSIGAGGDVHAHADRGRRPLRTRRQLGQRAPVANRRQPPRRRGLARAARPHPPLDRLRGGGQRHLRHHRRRHHRTPQPHLHPRDAALRHPPTSTSTATPSTSTPPTKPTGSRSGTAHRKAPAALHNENAWYSHGHCRSLTSDSLAGAVLSSPRLRCVPPTTGRGPNLPSDLDLEPLAVVAGYELLGLRIVENPFLCRVPADRAIQPRRGHG